MLSPLILCSWREPEHKSENQPKKLKIFRNFYDGSTLLQKTHHRAIYNRAMANLSLSWRREHVVGGPWAGRGVVLVRDPARAVLSYWNYWIMRSHVATADVTTRQSAIFEDFSTTG
jgi:hypothetical protein